MLGVPIMKITYKRFLTAREAATYLGYDAIKDFRADCPVSPELRSGKWKYDVAELDGKQMRAPTTGRADEILARL